MRKKVFKLLWVFIVTALLLTACQILPGLTLKREIPQDPSEGIGRTKVNPIDGMLMVYVPAGEFLMGSEAEGALEDEKPEHPVTLDAYWIYQTEVTNRQYNQCIQAGACSSTWEENPDDDHPVTQVFPRDGDDYCDWAGGRLPTEAEWEKAARGTDGRQYPWGNEPVTGARANFCDLNCDPEWGTPDTAQDDGYAKTAPVGSFPAGASPYGALDMAGNVWEWVVGSELMRGGSWRDVTQSLRVTNRFVLDGAAFDDIYFETFGFRCVQDDR